MTYPEDLRQYERTARLARIGTISVVPLAVVFLFLVSILENEEQSFRLVQVGLSVGFIAILVGLFSTRMNLAMDFREIKRTLVKYSLAKPENLPPTFAVFLIPFWEFYGPRAFITHFRELEVNPAYCRDLKAAEHGEG